MNKVPLILRCVTFTVVASFEGSWASLYLNHRVWRMVCATEVAQAREQSSWEYLQWAQEGRLAKGTISFPQRGAGGPSAREAEPGAPAGNHQPGQGSSGTEPLLTLQLLNTQQQHVHQICWWGHFYAPFIYWAVSLTLPPGWAFPASSLHCCHSVYYLDLFFHTHTYITKQPAGWQYFSDMETRGRH